MQDPKYPLEQLFDVKKDRVDKAERVVLEKKRALEIEQEKLKKVEAERDQVLHHHDEKLQQLRKSLDEGTTSPEILQMKAYLKVVKEKLAKAEANVKKQQEQVAIAEKNLQIAQEDLQKKRVELEKIKMHKEEWAKETKKEIEKQESRESDELGSITYETKRRRKQ